MSARKRRAKAVARRRWAGDLAELWDLRLARIPADAIAVMLCSCGARMWLREGATAEDREWFDDAASAHDYCDEAVAS